MGLWLLYPIWLNLPSIRLFEDNRPQYANSWIRSISTLAGGWLVSCWRFRRVWVVRDLACSEIVQRYPKSCSTIGSWCMAPTVFSCLMTAGLQAQASPQSFISSLPNLTYLSYLKLGGFPRRQELYRLFSICRYLKPQATSWLGSGRLKFE